MEGDNRKTDAGMHGETGQGEALATINRHPATR